jgi:GMP reductase
MKISNDVKLDFDDVLLVPARSPNASRADVELKRNLQFYQSNRMWRGIPLMASNMDTVGTLKMAEALTSQRVITCLHKFHNPIDFNLATNLQYSWVTIGMGNPVASIILTLQKNIRYSNYFPNICIDIANGYTDKFVGYCAEIREVVGRDPIIMAGNVCTPEQVQELILHGGVDIVKIGIGPGSACTTRLKTGVGYPQLSAIDECAHAAHGLKSGEKRLGLICADGGCRTPADVCKAFAANADFVMLGTMLAGTDECDGEWIYKKKYKTNWLDSGMPNGVLLVDTDQKEAMKFYGMSSDKAHEKHNGIKEYSTSEGREMLVPYRGPVKDVLKDITGGLRSCCAYIGATSLKDMAKCAKFVRVNRPHFNNE